MSRKQKFAKKSLGQNFLNSGEIRDKILKAAGNIEGKNILEIGPGLGFLTTKLMALKANVTAIEIDHRSCEILKRDFKQKKNLKIIEGDILEEDLDSLFEQKKYSIIANIPYNITSHLLRKILSESENKPEECIFMIQYEVAKKITDPKKKSLLSLSVEMFSQSNILFLVPKENFTPIPKVNSAVIKLTIREKPFVEKSMEKDFFRVVHAGFSQKRKKLGNTLPVFLGLSKEQILGEVDGNRRPETLSIEEWKMITQNFQKFARKEK